MLEKLPRDAFFLFYFHLSTSSSEHESHFNTMPLIVLLVPPHTPHLASLLSTQPQPFTFQNPKTINKCLIWNTTAASGKWSLLEFNSVIVTFQTSPPPSTPIVTHTQNDILAALWFLRIYYLLVNVHAETFIKSDMWVFWFENYAFHIEWAHHPIDLGKYSNERTVTGIMSMYTSFTPSCIQYFIKIHEMVFTATIATGISVTQNWIQSSIRFESSWHTHTHSHVLTNALTITFAMMILAKGKGDHCQIHFGIITAENGYLMSFFIKFY